MESEKGQSLVEVIIAATVGILVVSALTFATIFSLRNATLAKSSSQATKLAQEGIESVRTGRDRNSPITGNFAGDNVTSWNGDSNGVGSLWSYQINGNCGRTNPLTYCYFKIDNSGALEYLGEASSIPALADQIGQFKRVVILDDSATYLTQKKVTVIVTWTDFTGDHESKLVTILGKL